MSNSIPECVVRLRLDAGIDLDDAIALRKIAMTLHRWHELECGDSNDYASWCIVRGKPERAIDANGKAHRNFIYDDAGKPYIEKHLHSETHARYEPIADREAGALRRLARIMAKYPELVAYVQTDPRGAPLYIIRRADLPGGPQPQGHLVEEHYNRGIAVYK